MIKKFDGHEKANAYVIKQDDNNMVLISYCTAVIEVLDGWMYVNGLFSRTTMNHIGWFMKDYFNMSYYTAKQLFTNGMRMNIWTGEVEPIDKR